VEGRTTTILNDKTMRKLSEHNKRNYVVSFVRVCLVQSLGLPTWRLSQVTDVRACLTDKQDKTRLLCFYSPICLERISFP